MVSYSEVMLGHAVTVLFKPMLSEANDGAVQLHKFAHIIGHSVNVRDHIVGVVHVREPMNPPTSLDGKCVNICECRSIFQVWTERCLFGKSVPLSLGGID